MTNTPQRSAVVFGAGNVGRGFLGQLFSESGLLVAFVDVDRELVKALSERGWYRLETVFNEEVREYRIAPVTAFLPEAKEQVAGAVADAVICATAVGVRALPHIAPLLAAGIERRLRTSDAPLNIIICENLKNAAAHVRSLVRNHLPEDLLAAFEERIGFVDTVIGRMVPRPTEEMRRQDVSWIRVEPYHELPVDRTGFVGQIPTISGMVPCDNFPVYTARKLYLHNCGHALLAYPGYLFGLTFGWEALEHPEVRAVFDQGLRESREAIAAEFQVDPAWLDEHIRDLVRRFANRALGDTIFRLGRDPIRKLGPEDRLVGAARLVEKAGGRPEGLARGIAAALLFDPPEDPIAVELQERIRRDGPAQVLSEISGISPDEDLGRRVLESYNRWCELRKNRSCGNQER